MVVSPYSSSTGSGSVLEVSAKNDDRRRRRILLPIRRGNDRRREKRERTRDRGVHVLGGGIDVAIERKLQGDARRPQRAWLT